jgi:opacity protein-like surface antigen
MQQTLKSFLIVFALALLVPSIASAQNIYAAIRGGLGSTPPTNDGRPGSEDLSHHKTGLTTSGAVGYAWPSGLRGEGEFSFIYSPVESEAGVPLGGSIKSYLSMVNLIFGPTSSRPIKPNVGFGLGGARVNHNDEFFNSSGVKMQADETRTGFAYQIRAGLGYAINQRVDLSVGYRFVHINGGSVQQGLGADLHQVNFDVVKNHSIEVGFAVKF